MEIKFYEPNYNLYNPTLYSLYVYILIQYDV